MRLNSKSNLSSISSDAASIARGACQYLAASLAGDAAVAALTVHIAPAKAHNITVTRGSMAFKKRGKEHYFFKDRRLFYELVINVKKDVSAESVDALAKSVYSGVYSSLDVSIHSVEIFSDSAASGAHLARLI